MKLASSRRRATAALISATGLALSAIAFVAPSANAVASNDAFANATVLSGAVSAVGYGNNTGATTESGEPVTTAFGHTVNATLWWRWTAPVTGNYAISTAGSISPPVASDPRPVLDTTLSVFTGTSVSALTRVATNDDNALQDLTSATGFAATAGTTYDIQVGSFSSTTGTIRLTIGAADASGTMTYETSPSTAQPRAGCLGFYTDNTFTTLVVSGCGSGVSGTSATYAMGLVPAGTYFVEAVDGGPTAAYYPSGTTPATAAPLTIPGGGCTLNGLNVNFATSTFSAPSGKSCPFAPACQQAQGGVSQTATTFASANTMVITTKARVTAEQALVHRLKQRIKKNKKHGRPTAALTRRLTRLQVQLRIDSARLASAADAANTASANQAAAQAKVVGSC